MSLRVLIADDEPLNRARLCQLVQDEPGVEVVAQCATGREALQAIQDTSPDLAFLDVKMPEMDGFGVAQALGAAPLPVIVFVTAYAQFAARAFDVHAVDYLVKPFNRERLRVALNRVRERVGFLLAGGTNGSKTNAGMATPIASSPERVAVKANGRISLVNLAEVDWVCAADNYVELHVGRLSHLLRMTLRQVEEQLPRNRFQRISRSHLVNLEAIKEIRSKSHGDALVVLHNGTALPASRTYRRNLVRLFANLR